MDKCTLLFPVQGDSIFLGIKQHKYGKGLYNGWGGKHKVPDNMMQATALREFREESGGATFEMADLESVALINIYRDGVPLFECHVYFLHKWEGEMVATDEMGAPEEFLKADLPFEFMMASDRMWLPIVCRGEKIRAKVFYNQEMTEVIRFLYEPLP